MESVKIEIDPKNGHRKSRWTEDGNKQVICTGNKTFDKQTSAILPCQQWGNTIHSHYVRPHSEMECNGHTRPPGHLRTFDIGMFGRTLGWKTRKWLEQHKDAYVLVHCLYHYDRKRARGGLSRLVHHGAVITDSDHRLVALIYESWHPKARCVVDECSTYLVKLDPKDKFLTWAPLKKEAI